MWLRKFPYRRKGGGGGGIGSFFFRVSAEGEFTSTSSVLFFRERGITANFIVGGGLGQGFGDYPLFHGCGPQLWTTVFGKGTKK